MSVSIPARCEGDTPVSGEGPGMMELHAYQVWQSGSMRADHRLCVSARSRIMHHPCDTKGQKGFSIAVNRCSSSSSTKERSTVQVYMIGARFQFMRKFRFQKKNTNTENIKL